MINIYHKLKQMIPNNFIFNVYGSKDSIDYNVLINGTFDPTTVGDEIMKITRTTLPVNFNTCRFADGKLIWVEKGLTDEINNALLSTYQLHQQYHHCFVTTNIVRNLDNKIEYCINELLKCLSSTQHRQGIQRGINSNHIRTKIHVLKNIDLSELIFSCELDEIPHIWKIIAFQIGQTMCLFGGSEVYTKSLLEYKISSLYPFLYRDKISPDDYNMINQWLIILIDRVKERLSIK